MKALSAIGMALCLLGSMACSGSIGRSEGLDPSTLPADVRADYAVFAQRCSKCHSIARPLNSGISDMGYWSLYVARMRRQPGSGISQSDAAIILRFLQYYSLDQKRKKEPAAAVSSSARLAPFGAH
jgi:hypothetical protein